MDAARPWTPLVYSSLMLLLGVLALVWWDKGGRRVLFWAFAAGMIVGPLGFWFHNRNQPVENMQKLLAAWTQPVSEGHGGSGEGDVTGESGGHAESEETGGQESGEKHLALQRPPIIAPLSFFGLGLLGMLACARRFQPDSAINQGQSSAGEQRAQSS